MDNLPGKIGRDWRLRKKPEGHILLGAILAALAGNVSAQQDEPLNFDTGFLKFSDGESSSSFNLDYFSRSGGMLPGQYEVTVFVNDKKVDTRIVDFISRTQEAGRLQASIRAADLNAWGIQPQAEIVSALQAVRPPEMKTAGENRAYTLSEWVPQSQEAFDFQSGELRIIVPQAYVAPPGWLRTPPALWDQGMPALLLNYDYSGSLQNNEDGRNQNDFVSLNGLLNLWGWRLRHDMNWSRSSGAKGRWNSLNSWLQHDYGFWQGGQFTLGQTSTDGSILDSVPFRGVMMQSDDGMLNAEMGAFAPVIRGIANGNALVSVRQNGQLLYQKNVPPGPFELRDFSQAYAGDVDVEIKEADGSIRRFTQASATVPVLQRKGRVRYSLALGDYHQGNDVSNGVSRRFALASSAWGMGVNTTLYGGALLSRDYQSMVLGIGQYLTRLGAFSADVTHASTHLPRRGRSQGQAYRFAWARGFGATSLNLMAYRYATRGYYSFNDIQQMPKKALSQEEGYRRGHQRSRLQISASHSLGSYGSLSLSGSRDDYWNKSGYGQNWSASYGTSLKGISVSLSGGYSTSPYLSRADKSFSLSLSMPLNRLFGSGMSSVNYSTTAQNARTQHQMGVSGSLLQDDSLSYSLAQGWGNQGQGASGNLNLGYTASYGMINGGYGWQRNSRQWNYGLSGGVVVHPHGATLSQPLSLEGASALVEMPGASGVKVSHGNIRTDWFGYAVVPNLIPYERNEITADIQDLHDNVELKETNKLLIPAKGSLVSARFNAEVGRRVLITLQRSGKPVPFGAMVSVQLPDAVRTGIVADRGQVYLSGMPDSGTLTATWGRYEDERCQAEFRLAKDNGTFAEATAQCR
ncbi:fimbrial protein FimD [Serratia sp. MYb239]|nr:fimbrial protein FimD [Serratia sp. MYb239]